MKKCPPGSGTSTPFPAPPTSPQPPKFIGAGAAVQGNEFLTLAPFAGNAGDFLVAIIGTNNTIGGPGPPADWLLLLNAAAEGIALYAKIAEAADPPNWQWDFGAGVTISEGAILRYSTAGPLTGGATVVANTTPFQAPSAQQWKPTSLMLEAWTAFGAIGTWTISTNVNSPTTRVSSIQSSGGLFVVEYPIATFAMSTGDTARSLTANIRGALSQGIG